MQKNTLYTGDNFFILKDIKSNTVDLIYLDPPFNSKKIYKSTEGSEAGGAKFRDIWSWADVDTECFYDRVKKHPKLNEFIKFIDKVAGEAMMSYIAYMYIRIFEMHRILKPTGSIYLHCDPTASHYLKIIMDTIFGIDNFTNEIIWRYHTGGVCKKWYGKKHDVILFYTKSKRYTFNSDKIMIPRTDEVIRRIKSGTAGATRATTLTKYPDDVFDIGALNAMDKERLGYPTQKPLALMERIIKASSNEGDIVLDPFCGCATTCEAAQNLGRRWIGIDVAPQAVKLLKKRLGKDAEDFIHIDATKETKSDTQTQ